MLDGAIGKLLTEFELAHDHISVERELLGKAFGLRILGDTQLMARRMSKFMDSMRRPDGTWREHTLFSPTGQTINIYINRHRDPKQVKEDIFGRRLQGVVAKHLLAKGRHYGLTLQEARQDS